MAALDLETLNLDHDMLRHNRQEVVTRLQTLLRKDDSARRIRELLAVATTPPFPPFAFVASWYLRLKLRAREGSG